MDHHRDRGTQRPIDVAEPARYPSVAEPVTSIGGDDFYARTRAIGFDYGDAFRPSQASPPARTGRRRDQPSAARSSRNSINTGSIRRSSTVPSKRCFGAPFLGRGSNENPVSFPPGYGTAPSIGAPEKNMRARVRVVSATKEEVESDITIAGRDGEPLAVFDGFVVQSLSASSRMSPERIDKGLYEIQWCARRRRFRRDRRENGSPQLARPGSSSPTPPASVAPSPRNCAAAATASARSHTNPSMGSAEIDGGYALNTRGAPANRPAARNPSRQGRQPRRHRQLLATDILRKSSPRRPVRKCRLRRVKSAPGRVHHPSSRQSPRRARHRQARLI